VKRLLAGLSAALVASAGGYLAPGTAHASCAIGGVCSHQWCPGRPIPKGWLIGPGGVAQPVDDAGWDMSVYNSCFSAADDLYGGVPVGTTIGSGSNFVIPMVHMLRMLLVLGVRMIGMCF
jgi:hypothetical protein